MTAKPLLRGHFHQAAFFVALGSCLLLVLKASSTISTIAVSIYSFSLINLLGTSALYHRINWSVNKRKWMKRLDHSAIYVLIAGTFTPICLLALPPTSGKNLLITIWSVATLGILQSLFYVQAPKWLSAILYVVAGYLILPYISELNQSIGEKNIILLILGGVLYTIGALAYALKKPHLKPEIIGYHEVFHLLVIAGAACHFSIIYQLLDIFMS
jgi:hemolysin III